MSVLGPALRLLATLLHAGLMLALAPLLAGLIRSLQARLLGMRGPPVLQSYHDLRKLSGKATLIPDNATDLVRVWPYAAFAASVAAALLVPGFCTGMLTAGSSDFITLAGLFGIARAATILAGLETGFGFGGAAASRQIMFGGLAAAALLLVMLIIVLAARDPTIDGAAVALRAAAPGLRLGLGFALAAALAASLTGALTETGLLPGEAPSELAMRRQALLLEFSGRLLLLFEAAAMLRLLVLMSLFIAVFAPFGMGSADAVLSWPAGLLCWLGKLALLAGGLAVVRAATAGLRVFRVPAVLGAAVLLGFLGVMFQFIAPRG
jgi:formate hydrogenlyase subunit 4